MRKANTLIGKANISIRKTNTVQGKRIQIIQMALSTPQSSGFPMESLPEKHKKHKKNKTLCKKCL